MNGDSAALGAWQSSASDSASLALRLTSEMTFSRRETQEDERGHSSLERSMNVHVSVKVLYENAEMQERGKIYR